MDLVSAPEQTKIIVVTDHCDKKGKSKIVAQCSLPLTGSRCVSLIITDMVCTEMVRGLSSLWCQAVFDVDRTAGTMTLRELMPGVTLEEVRVKTAAPFQIGKDLRQIDI